MAVGYGPQDEEFCLLRKASKLGQSRIDRGRNLGGSVAGEDARRDYDGLPDTGVADAGGQVEVQGQDRVGAPLAIHTHQLRCL
eukprot:5023044-Alexandrium_andersonii.AAC.1